MKNAMGSRCAYRTRVVSPEGIASNWATDLNLMPEEGINYAQSVLFKKMPAFQNWYIALYEGVYTPSAELTAAQFPALATESTAYEGGERKLFVPGEVSNGMVDNVANVAKFKFTSNRTIYGGALLSAPGWGSTSGVAISAVRFDAPKPVAAGYTLEILVGNFLTSI